MALADKRGVSHWGRGVLRTKCMINLSFFDFFFTFSLKQVDCMDITKFICQHNIHLGLNYALFFNYIVIFPFRSEGIILAEKY